MSDTTDHTTTTIDPHSPMPDDVHSTRDTTEPMPPNDNTKPVDYNMIGKPAHTESVDPDTIVLDPDLEAIVRRDDPLGNVTRYEFNSLVVKFQEMRGPATAPSKPVNVDVPHVQQDGGRLTCTMGNWEGEPTSYAYAWTHNGDAVAMDSAELTLTADEVGDTFVCTVSATNAAGTTAAPPSDAVVVEAWE